MSGFGSEKIGFRPPGLSTRPKSQLEAEIFEESPAEELGYLSPKAGQKRAAEVSMEEPSRKKHEAWNAGADELVLSSDFEDQLDEYGRTSLHIAAAEGHVAIVKELLSSGAYTRWQDDEGMTPLHQALYWEEEDIAQLILDVDSKNSLYDEYGRTPLHVAAKKGQVEIVKRLLAAGNNIRCRDSEGKTPLHLALACGNEQAAEALLDVDVETSLRDEGGNTTLHHAAMQGYVEIVKKLLAAGASTRVQNKLKRTPLHLALYSGKQQAAEVIVDVDAENNLPDKYRRTPLHYAALKDYMGVMRKLVFSGANPHLKDNFGVTAFDIAGRLSNSLKFVVPTSCAFEGSEIFREKLTIWESVRCRCMKLVAKCEVEILRMKETNVCDSIVSYYDVVTKHPRKVAAYLGINQVRKELLEGSVSQSFPNYANWIAFRVEKAEKRRLLNDQCFKCYTIFDTQLPRLPEIVVENIFSYLTEHELQNFEKAFTFNA